MRRSMQRATRLTTLEIALLLMLGRVAYHCWEADRQGSVGVGGLSRASRLSRQRTRASYARQAGINGPPPTCRDMRNPYRSIARRAPGSVGGHAVVPWLSC
ncbi:hypothetical protein C8Q78DRAFT_505939 [Trametes maxima]|nr:hypothetical protein C8Q78DRAFT_505939 [Trametes maxima]